MLKYGNTPEQFAECRRRGQQKFKRALKEVYLCPCGRRIVSPGAIAKHKKKCELSD